MGKRVECKYLLSCAYVAIDHNEKLSHGFPMHAHSNHATDTMPEAPLEIGVTYSKRKHTHAYPVGSMQSATAEFLAAAHWPQTFVQVFIPCSMHMHCAQMATNPPHTAGSDSRGADL